MTNDSDSRYRYVHDIIARLQEEVRVTGWSFDYPGDSTSEACTGCIEVETDPDSDDAGRAVFAWHSEQGWSQLFPAVVPLAFGQTRPDPSDVVPALMRAGYDSDDDETDESVVG